MTTRFDAAFAAGGLSESFSQFGQSAIYAPIDGPEVTATMIFRPERVELSDVQGVDIRMRKMEVTIGKDPDSEWSGVAAVSTDSKIILSSEDWDITSIVAATGASTIVEVERPEVGEYAGRGFRGGI